MSTPPSGTVTFLFTDIEGSTKLALEHPETWETLRARHHAILTTSMEAHNGYTFQIIGDAFCVAFHTVRNGLNAALEAQRQLQLEDWGETPVKVRMGLHTGAAEIHGNDYRGYLTLARVQRVMSVAYGGQVLLSNASAELLHGELPPEIALRDLKEHRLKGLSNPEHLWQMVASNLLSDFPPLQSLKEIPNNLPIQLTSFIGRENEIAEVKQELESHHLVTLTGSGGTGKTRLSLQVAANLLDQFDHGVWFVELAPLTDPELIPQTILSVIGISEQLGKTPIEMLKEYLHEKSILIILDNCEHLISASAKVANDLLNAAPKLNILASSREALGVKGEASYPIPSLSLPDIKHLPVIEQLSQYEAVRLFTDRALLVAPHFDVNKENAPAIAHICYRLDGVPLAIELAAARVKVLSVEQISKRLDDRFRLLTGGARTALPRQQTLRALIDWSYDLLSENERLLLRRLSVFAGGCSLEAAEEVCSGDSIATYDVLDLLIQLVNKSLVIVIEGAQSGETRYRMLETIRQYAREKLLEFGAGETLRDRHLIYFVKLAERAEFELYRTEQVFWLNKLDEELDNLRMALEWALTTNVEWGLRLIIAPRLFWEVHGDVQELISWLGQLLAQHNKVDALHVHALIIYSYALAVGGNHTQAQIAANRGVELARGISDKHTEALSLLGLGAAIAGHGDLERGMPLVEQSRDLFWLLGDKIQQAYATTLLGMNTNDLERSKFFLFESLKLYRELGSLSNIAFCLNELALRAVWAADFSSAVPWLEEALSLHRQLGNHRAEASVLENYGNLSYWQGDYEKAIFYFEESIKLCEKIGVSLQDWLHVHIAYARLRQSYIPKAKEMFERSIQGFQKANNVIGLIYTLEGLASLSVNQDQPERATQLFAWSDAMREKIGDHRPPVEQASVEHDLAVIHSKLSDAEYAELCAQGQAMTIERAVTLALED